MGRADGWVLLAVLSVGRTDALIGLLSGVWGSLAACGQPASVRSFAGLAAGGHPARPGLTYSCVWPKTHRLAAGRLQLYEAVHASLIELLADEGIKATLYGQAGPGGGKSLRFSVSNAGRRATWWSGAAKVAGSAQRRLRGADAAWQRAVGRSPAAELDGLAELAEACAGCPAALQAWGKRLENRLKLVWQATPLSAEEYQQAVTLVETKYGSLPWTHNRGR